MRWSGIHSNHWLRLLTGFESLQTTGTGRMLVMWHQEHSPDYDITEIPRL
ncbi:MAG: hypothetical protein IPO71_13640 [Nitrosomonas sp.]|nr:hypothetical protein [Nitrosomonas sp.]